MRKIGGILALAFAVLFLATGRFLVAVPLALIGLTLLGRNPLAGLWNAPQNAATGAKRFRTTLLDVQIDIATGAIVGRVVAGRFARRTLGSLSPHEAAALWREARIKDPAGAQIMEAVLDRLDPRWRELQGGKTGAQADVKGQITISEAYNVLGLSPGATRADIQHAHRELMKRFHPDQGGSNYLAAKINEAKDVLLARLPE